MQKDLLIPAHAGVIPDGIFVFIVLPAYPRARGGDPNSRMGASAAWPLIPAHAGVIPCDAPPRHEKRAYQRGGCLWQLIPAHAGVILLCAAKKKSKEAYPRARGGDPLKREYSGTVYYLSPRTRG